jgi:hypothetical protein
MDDAYEFRNLVAHATWGKGAGKATIRPFEMKAKRGELKFTGHGLKHQDFSSTWLENEAQKTSRLQSDFLQFFSAHLGFDLDALPPKNRKKGTN